MTPGKSATSREAARYVAHMAGKFRARIVERDDAVEVQMIDAALRTATGGLLTIKKIFGQYSTTIGSLVYLSENLTPDQTISIVTHECEHVRQFHDEGLKNAFLYVTSGEARARYEALAYGAQAEIDWARFRVKPDPDELVWPLEQAAYLLTKPNKKFARKLLAVRAAQVARGVLTSKPARVGIAFLKKTMPHLLAKS